MNALISLLAFGIMAALILVFSGRQRLAHLIIIVCFAGIVADMAAHAIENLPPRQSTTRRAVRRSTIGYTAQMAATYPPCDKSAPVLWLTKEHDTIRLTASPVCWSQKVCGGAGITRFSVRSRTLLAGCAWFDDPLWNNGMPLCYGPGPEPNYKWIPDCARVLGVGEYEFEGVFPASAY